MGYIFWWLILAVPCFFVAYCNGANMNYGRMKSANYDYDGFLSFYKKFFSEGFSLFVHDYFGMYCPWSWQRAKRYRLADMRTFLGERGQRHERLGNITAADCDNPEKQDGIARHAYISRTDHWLNGCALFLIAPITGSLVIISIMVQMIVLLRRRFSKGV